MPAHSIRRHAPVPRRRPGAHASTGRWGGHHRRGGGADSGVRWRLGHSILRDHANGLRVRQSTHQRGRREGPATPIRRACHSPPRLGLCGSIDCSPGHVAGGSHGPPRGLPGSLLAASLDSRGRGPAAARGPIRRSARTALQRGRTPGTQAPARWHPLSGGTAHAAGTPQRAESTRRSIGLARQPQRAGSGGQEGGVLAPPGTDRFRLARLPAGLGSGREGFSYERCRVRAGSRSPQRPAAGWLDGGARHLEIADRRPPRGGWHGASDTETVARERCVAVSPLKRLRASGASPSHP